MYELSDLRLIVVAGTEGVPQSSAAEKANPEEVQRTSDGRPLQVATSLLHKM